MSNAYIGLGSNMGEPADNLETALRMLDQTEGLKITAVSSLYKTEPVGYIDQAWFYNCVAAVRTSLIPEQLLLMLQKIENSMGRVRDMRWGPRVIDLDILLYDRVTVNTEQLIIPHPRMAERAFVMVPLAEIASDSAVFPDGRTAGEVRDLLGDEKKIICINRKLW